MDKLKSSVKTGVIEPMIALSIFPKLPSGPEALLVSMQGNQQIKNLLPSAEHSF